MCGDGIGLTMTEDIVTKLEFLLQEAADIIKEQAEQIELLKAELQRLNDCMGDIYSAAFFGVHGE